MSGRVPENAYELRNSGQLTLLLLRAISLAIQLVNPMMPAWAVE
jgi:hypothetical protein